MHESLRSIEVDGTTAILELRRNPYIGRTVCVAEAQALVPY